LNYKNTDIYLLWAIKIPESWIVDWDESKVSVLLLVKGGYQRSEFTESERIISQTFPELTLTAEEVLSA
jgi:Uma2 family endonuclease